MHLSKRGHRSNSDHKLIRAFTYHEVKSVNGTESVESRARAGQLGRERKRLQTGCNIFLFVDVISKRKWSHNILKILCTYVLEHETSNAFTHFRVLFGCLDGKGFVMKKVVAVNPLIQNFCSKIRRQVVHSIKFYQHKV